MNKLVLIKMMALLGIWIGAPLITYSVDRISNHQTTCIFDAIGLQCLGCGMSKAIYWLVRGNLTKAVTSNPLIIVWIIGGSILIISEIYHPNHKDSLGDWLIKKAFRGIKF